MTIAVLTVGAILLACVLSSKMLYRFGIPTLLIFISLGILLGSEGIGGIYFDNAQLAATVCSVGLIFIMFYGGFGVNWKVAKPIAPMAVLLASLGVIATAGLVGLFAWKVLKFEFLNAMLLGAVISSTDAASVFSILRSRNLNLKSGLAPLLEMESGSNDPTSYMLTVIVVSLITGRGSGNVFLMALKQVSFGLIIGFSVAFLAVFALRRANLEIDGLYSILVIGIVLFSYGVCDYIGGNGYLCVYIIGIVLSNGKIPHKRSLVHFFDGLTWLMQIVIFFTLGLLLFPSQLPKVMITGIAVAVFLSLIARPAAVMAILSFFKVPIKEQIFVSWVGLRGVASVVFAAYALANNVPGADDIFNTVFIISIFSLIVQGTFIPALAKKLDIIDDNVPTALSFSDYEDQMHEYLAEYVVYEDNAMAGKAIMDANIPDHILVVVIKRDKEIIVPKGQTKIKVGDILLLGGNDLSEVEEMMKPAEIGETVAE